MKKKIFAVICVVFVVFISVGALSNNIKTAKADTIVESTLNELHMSMAMPFMYVNQSTSRKLNAGGIIDLTLQVVPAQQLNNIFIDYSYFAPISREVVAGTLSGGTVFGTFKFVQTDLYQRSYENIYSNIYINVTSPQSEFQENFNNYMNLYTILSITFDVDYSGSNPILRMYFNFYDNFNDEDYMLRLNWTFSHMGGTGWYVTPLTSYGSVTEFYRRTNAEEIENINQYNIGYRIGYDEAYGQLYNSRYNKGYQDAVNTGGVLTFRGLISAVVDVPIETLAGLMNFDVFGTNFYYMFQFIFTTLMILIPLKIVIGLLLR